VHLARDVRSGNRVAIKRAKLSTDLEGGGIHPMVLREIKAMQAVRHPNVMGCLDVFADVEAINLVMELMDSDLKKLVEDEGGVVFAEPHVKCLAKQILEGLLALHSNFFVHRDLTPMNILVNYSTGMAKITDFGSSRTLGHRDLPLTSVVTTLWYRAPEIFFGAKYYGQPVDLWSVGCVLAELFLRQPLFHGHRDMEMLTLIIENRGCPSEETWQNVQALPNFWMVSDQEKPPLATLLPGVSAPTLSLIDDLLSMDPKRRPTCAQALEHEFFSAAPQACQLQELPFVSVVQASQ